MIGGRRYSDAVADARRSIWPYARQLQEDEKLRQRLFAALAACLAAWGRMRQSTQLRRRMAQLVSDPVLRRELYEAARQLDEAQKRIEHGRRHRLRNVLFAAVGVGAAAVALRSVRIRPWFLTLLRGKAERDFVIGDRTASPSPTAEPAGVPQPTTPERGL
jgi:hypothetical protein